VSENMWNGTGGTPLGLSYWSLSTPRLATVTPKRLEVSRRTEPDIGEQVLSGAWNPRFRDKVTLLECL